MGVPTVALVARLSKPASPPSPSPEAGSVAYPPGVNMDVVFHPWE